MKQRHSFTNLVYHMVFCTKNREHLINKQEEIDALIGFLKTKVQHLDAYILELGGWRDHVHLLIRTRPTTALCEIYRQLKGFSSRAWHKHFPDSPFAWADGVYAVTVDPDNCEHLKTYIRNQEEHHERKTTLSHLEPSD